MTRCMLETGGGVGPGLPRIPVNQRLLRIHEVHLGKFAVDDLQPRLDSSMRAGPEHIDELRPGTLEIAAGLQTIDGAKVAQGLTGCQARENQGADE